MLGLNKRTVFSLIITALAQLITAPAKPPATGVVVFTVLLYPNALVQNWLMKKRGVDRLLGGVDPLGDLILEGGLRFMQVSRRVDRAGCGLMESFTQGGRVKPSVKRPTGRTTNVHFSKKRSKGKAL